jgi:endonuclease YncB( thermonuclease family)
MGFPGVSARTVLAAMAAGCVALGGAVAWQLWPADRTTNVIGALSNISLRPVTAKPVEGRAAALSGDTLRVNNQVFVLSGIEAPDRQQACLQNGKRRWRCGERAQLALEAALRAGPVVCTPSTSTDANGRTPASCTMAGKDLADGLVRAGHVFAIPATFGGYGAAEAEARTKKAGLWSGEAERPSVYRARLWDAAKKTSPEGCPIKGTIQGGMKVFVQPWDSGYRRAQVRANRGERWFCNATDAVAAGFKPAERAG